MKCPECDGSGKHEPLPGFEKPDGFAFGNDCETCGGKGAVHAAYFTWMELGHACKFERDKRNWSFEDAAMYVTTRREKELHKSPVQPRDIELMERGRKDPTQYVMWIGVNLSAVA